MLNLQCTWHFKTHLRTKRSLLMKVAPDKITVLLGCYATHAVYTNTTRVANHFTHHVLSHLVFVAEALLRDGIGLTTDRPLRDVIRPFVWCNRCWRLTKSEAVKYSCCPDIYTTQNKVFWYSTQYFTTVFTSQWLLHYAGDNTAVSQFVNRDVKGLRPFPITNFNAAVVQEECKILHVNLNPWRSRHYSPSKQWEMPTHYHRITSSTKTTMETILGKWPTWRTILFYVFISILYMFWATSCSSSG